MSLARILSMPAEIRGLIFEYVVTSEVVVTYRLDSYSKDSYTEATQPALTRVSRQIRAESLPLFYECNEFVLHTELQKANDSRRWLQCNEFYLPRVCRISFWVRYFSPALVPQNSQGAISVSMSRRRVKKEWHVDDTWKWITVVRRPSDIDSDAGFLIESLADLLDNMPNPLLSPDSYSELMIDLQRGYMKEKVW